MQIERDELYRKFVKAIHEVQQKSNFKNLLLEKKLGSLADTLEKKEAQLNEVLSASNLDPTALTVVTRKLEVSLGHKTKLEQISMVLRGSNTIYSVKINYRGPKR